MAITTRETITRVTSLVPGEAAPSGTTRHTETFFTTYTFYKTAMATAGGGPPRITSTEEVTTQVVVTEAARVPVIVPLPVATRPVVLTTVPTQQLPEVQPLTPSVEPSLSTDSSSERNSVVMAATRTFYTTSTFYTTLVESGSTVVRSRTELTSRVQTELTTKLFQLAPSAVRPVISPTVTWLGQSGHKQQQQVPIRQAAAAAMTKVQTDGVESNSAESTATDFQTSSSSPGAVSEEDKNAVLQAIQALVAEADKKNAGAGQAAWAPAALIPDTIISTPESLGNAQMGAGSQSPILPTGGIASAAVIPVISKKSEATKVLLGVKPLTSKMKVTKKPTKAHVQPPRKSAKPQAPASGKPTRPQTQAPSGPVRSQVPAPSKTTKPQAVKPSKPMKVQTANKPVKHQTSTPSQFPIAPAPVAVPSPATSTIQSSVQITTSTSVSESSALSPGLGGLAGGLLGLGGLAAGLIRNVIPLPLPLRRDGSPVAPISGSSFLRHRPGGRPGVRLSHRTVRPSFRPLSANRRHQIPGNSIDNGYLVVIGPDGQRIQLNRATESGHTPPTRRTGHLAGIPSRGGAPNGIQGPQSPKRRTVSYSGAPVRRVDHPHRPQPVSRPLTRIPSRINGQPPRRSLRPGRPHGRPVGPNHLHRPRRPVSRRPRPHPTGYIAVRPGDPTPPSSSQHEPSQSPQPGHGGSVYQEHPGHSHTPDAFRSPQSASPVRVAPTHAQNGAVRPPPRNPGTVKSPALQHAGFVGQLYQQHAPDVRLANPNHDGNKRHPPTKHTGPVGPPPVREYATNARPPTPHPQEDVGPQPSSHYRPARPSPAPSHVQVNSIHGSQVPLQGHPRITSSGISQVPPTGVSAFGDTAPHSQPETLFREHMVKPPQLQTDALVFKSDINRPLNLVTGDTRVTSHLPSYHELNNGSGRKEPSDDQKSSASVLTNIGPDGTVQNNHEDVVRVFTAPAHVEGQVLSATPILVPTLHTIASVEGPNRIVGTNVFKQVGPLPTLKTLGLGADGQNAVRPSLVTKVQTIQNSKVVSSSSSAVGGATGSWPSSGSVSNTDSIFTPEDVVTPGFSGSVPDYKPLQSSGPEYEVATGIGPEQPRTPGLGAPIASSGTVEGVLTGYNGIAGAGSQVSQAQRFDAQSLDGTLAHFGQKIHVSGAKQEIISSTGESMSYFENTSDSETSLIQVQPEYLDDSEEQKESSTDDDNIGDNHESRYNSLANINIIPGAPNLPGLAGIGLEQLSVTTPPAIKTQSLYQPNTLEEYDEEPTPEYNDEDKSHSSLGYDYSVPQYDLVFEDPNAEHHPESDINIKPFGSPTFSQSIDDKQPLTNGFVVNSQTPSRPGKPVPTTSIGTHSSINDPLNADASIKTDKHDGVDGMSPSASKNGEEIGTYAWEGAQVDATIRDATIQDSPWTNAQSGQTVAHAWSQGSTAERDDNPNWNGQGKQGQRDVTAISLGVTVVPAWNQSPRRESDDNAEWSQEHQENIANPISAYKHIREGDGYALSDVQRQRPASSGNAWSDSLPGNVEDSPWTERTSGETLNSTSAEARSPEDGNPGWINGQTNVRDVPFGLTQQTGEYNVSDKQQELTGEREKISGSAYESEGSLQKPSAGPHSEFFPSVLSTNDQVSSGTSGQKNSKESTAETQFIQEQHGVTGETSTSDSVNDNDDRQGSTGTSSSASKPFGGIVRTSTTRKASRGTVPITRPFRGTVRPSATRRPFRESGRPLVTRRPFRGTRRPAAIRRPFTGIKRPEWAQLNEDDNDLSRPVSTSGVSQGTGTNVSIKAKEWEYNSDSEQSYEETVFTEATDSETGVASMPVENETNESYAYETGLTVHELSIPTQQELDLDLDPSIKEEWVQTIDDIETADGSQGLPGISLASSVEQASPGATASSSRTPGLNIHRFPNRKKPNRRPSLADIIRETLLASHSSSTLVTVDLSLSSSLNRISSVAIASTRTSIPPGLSASQTTDRLRISQGVVHPGLAQQQDKQNEGWPSYHNEYGTGSSAPTDEQETGTAGSSWDYGQTRETAVFGWPYGEDYERGTSGSGLGQDHDTGASAPRYNSDNYETGTSASTDDGTPQDAQVLLHGDEAKDADKTRQIGEGSHTVEEQVNDGEESIITKGKTETSQTDKTIKAKTAQPLSGTQDAYQPDDAVPSSESEIPNTKADVTLSISTSEISQEVSVQHSVSEASVPLDAGTKVENESESPIEVVVGVSTTGGVVADVSEFTTTEKPMPTTAGPAATLAIQKVRIINCLLIPRWYTFT